MEGLGVQGVSGFRIFILGKILADFSENLALILEMLPALKQLSQCENAHENSHSQQNPQAPHGVLMDCIVDHLHKPQHFQAFW